MMFLKSFSMGRVALPLATLLALTGAILIYVIRGGRISLFFHGCFLVYTIFGTIRTYIVYKKEGGFVQLCKDLLMVTFGIMVLFVLGVCLGRVIG